MQTQYRTELQIGSWLQCFRCRKPTLMHELIGRQEVVEVTKAYSWIGFPLMSYRHYQVVSVCPTCATQEDEAIQQRRKWRVGMSLGLGALFVVEHYLGTTWMFISSGLTIIGAYWRRSQHRALVLRKETL